MSWEDIEAIKRVKYSYCNGIDRCDIDLLKSIMCPDMEVDYVGGHYRFKASGRDDVLAAMKQSFHENFVSCHTVHMPFIDLTGDRTATGRWRLLDYALNMNENNLVTIGAAEYSDIYEKGDDNIWRLKRSGYVRIYERVFNDPDPHLTHFILGGGHVDKSTDYADAVPYID